MRTIEPLVNRGQIVRPKLDPCALESVLISWLVGRLARREVRKFDAEGAAVGKRDEHNRMREPKFELAHVASKHVLKKRGEAVAKFGPHEQMNARPETRNHCR